MKLKLSLFLVILFSLNIVIFNIFKNKSICLDWTVQKPIESRNKYINNTWLISFANNDTYKSAQYFLNFTANRNGFKKIISYDETDITALINQNKTFFEKYKQGYGLWSWKPYIILETLKKIPENDIVLYLDSASAIGNDMSEIFSNFDNKDNFMITFYHDCCKLFKKPHTKNCDNEEFTKKSFLKAMNLDNDKYLKSYQIMAASIIVKNTPQSRNLIKKWLDMSLNEEFATSLTKKGSDFINFKNEIEIQNTFFKEHKNDQAILNALIEKNPKGIIKLSTIEYTDFKSEGFKSKKSSIIYHTKRKLKKSLIDLVK